MNTSDTSDRDITIRCECNSPQCNRTVTLPLEEAARYVSQDLVLIADGCQPDPGDVLVSSHDGYRLYSQLA